MDDLETSSKEIDPFDKFIIQNIKKIISGQSQEQKDFERKILQRILKEINKNTSIIECDI